MRISIFFIGLLLFLLVSSWFAGADSVLSKNVFLGQYCTISESEWSVCLNFKADGIVDVVSENWLPREYDDRTAETVEGKWKEVAGRIHVTVGCEEYTYDYYTCLSLNLAGLEGCRPGIVEIDPAKWKKFSNVGHMWFGKP